MNSLEVDNSIGKEVQSMILHHQKKREEQQKQRENSIFHHVCFEWIAMLRLFLAQFLLFHLRIFQAEAETESDIVEKVGVTNVRVNL